ncbi:MAG: RcpC/CpaB family pilus assembly protein [Actinomycetota bacterium]|nr:RcpC/CpaB family pilus assembly protein [Actinomycetota bacterium]
MKLTRKRMNGPSIGGLLATRQGAVTVALVCAIVATAILVFAIGKYRHAVAGGPKQVTVLVATSAIPKGSSASLIASQGLYKVTPILDTQVSPGAIIDAASLAGKIAANNILPGQQLTAADFTTGPVGLTAGLSPTERAIAMTLDPAHGAGVLEAGDHVDLYGSFAGGTGTTTANLVALLVSNAVVLKAPGASGSSSASQGSSVLLGVSMQLSPKVMWVVDYGKVWLELRGVNSSNPQPTVTTVHNVLAGNHTSLTVNGVSGTLTYTTPSATRTPATPATPATLKAKP